MFSPVNRLDYELLVLGERQNLSTFPTRLKMNKHTNSAQVIDNAKNIDHQLNYRPTHRIERSKVKSVEEFGVDVQGASAFGEMLVIEQPDTIAPDMSQFIRVLRQESA